MAMRAWTQLIVLIILGILGNYFSLPLFFGADFLFGSVAVLLVLYCFGLGWGLLAAVIVHGYTFALWGHPYGFIVFVLETLFIGFLHKSGRKNIVLLDGLFWLLIGIPLNGIIYSLVLHLSGTTTTFIILKQGINGIFNALLVGLAVNHLPLERLMGQGRSRRTFSLQETSFNLLVAVVLVPGLLLTILQARSEMINIEATLLDELNLLSVGINAHVNSWYVNNLHTVKELAKLSAKGEAATPTGLQHDLEVMKNTEPDILTLHVENKDGVTVACSPKANQKGSTIGVNLAERAWFKITKATRATTLSNVFLGSALTFSPIVTLSVPVLREDRFAGTATASMNLKQIEKLLHPFGRKLGMMITVLDAESCIVASTAKNLSPAQYWNYKGDGVVSPVNTAVFRLSPRDKKLPSMARWNKSYFVQETKVGQGMPWNLIIQASLAPHQEHLYAMYVQNLSFLAALIVLAIFLAHILSQRLSKPLGALAQVTTDLPNKIVEHQNVDWPENSITEIDSLISNFRSMTQALEESFQKLKEHFTALNMTLNATADGIMAVNTDGKVSFYNHRFSEMFDISQAVLDTGDDTILQGEMLGKLSDPAGFMKEVQRLYNSSDSSSDVVHFKNGDVIERYSIPMLDGDSKLTGRVWSFRSITERRRAEEKRNRLEAQLLQSQKMEAIGSLAGGVAHDFNNILTVIIGHGSMLQMDDRLTCDQKQQLGHILAASEKAVHLTRGLLAFSRKQAIDPKVVDLNQVITKVSAFLIRVIGEDIVLRFHPGMASLPVNVDSAQIEQVLMNLATNARDAMPKGGSLTIETGLQKVDAEFIQTNGFGNPGKYAVIKVSDTGLGMDAETCSRVFDPFFTTKEVGKGTGLGLSIVYGVIEQHQGYIKVVSEPGQGATFRIYLNVIEQVSVADTEQAVPEPPPRGSETILLAEDEDGVRNLTVNILTKFGYRVIEAKDGQEAVDMFIAHRDSIQMVLMDVIMPKKNGTEAFAEIVRVQPGTKVLFSSGYTADFIKARGVAEEGINLIMKPVRPLELLQMVRKVLDS